MSAEIFMQRISYQEQINETIYGFKGISIVCDLHQRTYMGESFALLYVLCLH